MLVSGVLIWLTRIGLLLFLITASGPVFAEAFQFNDDSWEGTREFLNIARAKLGKNRVKIVATLDWEKLKPSDGLVVIHPKANLEHDQATAFMRAGGRVAVLDDFGRGADFLDRFGIKRINAPTRPRQALRGNPNYAVAVPSVQTVAGQEQGRHPVVSGVQHLVTNHPSGLTHPSLTPVLEIPALGEPNTTLAVTGVIANRGRLFVMGDPSAVINLMLRYPGNRKFSEGLINYLVEPDTWGKRGGDLYLLSGNFSQQGRFGGEEHLLDELESFGRDFWETVADFHDDGVPREVAFLLGALCLLIAGLSTLFTAARPYRGSKPRYAAEQPLLMQAGAAGRAALLAADTTHPALAALELKSALEETVAEKLGLESTPDASTLPKLLEQRAWLNTSDLRQLSHFVREMKRIEDAVVASNPIRVRDGDVTRHAQTLSKILTAIDGRET